MNPEAMNEENVDVPGLLTTLEKTKIEEGGNEARKVVTEQEAFETLAEIDAAIATAADAAPLSVENDPAVTTPLEAVEPVVGVSGDTRKEGDEGKEEATKGGVEETEEAEGTSGYTGPSAMAPPKTARNAGRRGEGMALPVLLRSS